MDVAGLAAERLPLIRFSLILALTLGLGGRVCAQVSLDEVKQLAAQEHWQEIVNLTEKISPRSADLDYYYGTALAHLGQWDAARSALLTGMQLRPDDEKFPLELAGVAFKEKHYTESVRYLRRALRLAPNDDYANDFLATVYYLQGNVEAAIKYWNRAGKPRIASVRADPEPQIDPVLLDHALQFAPASTLELPELLASEARIRGLGIFSSFNFGVLAREDGTFDVTFQNDERNGFGANKWEALVRVFRNLPSQTVNPEYYNLHGKAINIVSMYRWDSEKRRVRAEVSAPWRGEPKRRLLLGADLLNENWDIRSSFTGSVPLLGSLNQRREAVNATITSFPSGRWNWNAGVEMSHRDFRSVFAGTALTPGLLAQGFQLKQTAGINADVLYIPERRMTVSAGLSSQAGRIWSSPSQSFEKLQASVLFHWLPQSTGDDYEIQHQLRGGKTWGEVPFDELFMLGGLGDNNLSMRGHITTHHGRKGSGPMGRNYFLSNWEIDKNVYRNSFLTLKAGPLLDVGKITDPSPRLGSHKWLWDTGGQIKAKALGVGVALSYGKDLRSGNDAVFLTMLF